MRIGLIAMSGVRVRTPELAALGVSLPQFVNRGKVIASLPSLGLLTVAALTPKDVEVQYREVADLPSPETDLERFDLVGISSFSAQIDEAYALADRYRKAGVPVVVVNQGPTRADDLATVRIDAPLGPTLPGLADAVGTTRPYAWRQEADDDPSGSALARASRSSRSCAPNSR